MATPPLMELPVQNSLPIKPEVTAIVTQSPPTMETNILHTEEVETMSTLTGSQTQMWGTQAYHQKPLLLQRQLSTKHMTVPTYKGAGTPQSPQHINLQHFTTQQQAPPPPPRTKEQVLTQETLTTTMSRDPVIAQEPLTTPMTKELDGSLEQHPTQAAMTEHLLAAQQTRATTVPLPVATLKRPSTISLTSSKTWSPKKVKPNLVKPRFDVKYAEHLIHIGNARYVVYGVVEGYPILRIQECDYKVQNGEKQQTKMIRFTIQQWIDLAAQLGPVNDAIEEFDLVKIHIGRNTYISVQPDRRRVDIREYFLPDNKKCRQDIAPNEFEPVLIPTRRGISLTYEEWTRFTLKAMPLINAGAEQLQTARAGSCISQHNAQKEWLLCQHCNPNGYTFW
jgi:hypothetical protein